MSKVMHWKIKSNFKDWSFGDPPKGFSITPQNKTAIPEEWLQEVFSQFMDCVLEETDVHFMELNWATKKELKNRPCPYGEPHPLDMFIEFGAGSEEHKPAYMFNLLSEIEQHLPYITEDDIYKPMIRIRNGLQDAINMIDAELAKISTDDMSLGGK